MHTFTIIWLGQMISTIGTRMTVFAITLWAWELTGSATALALIGFFYFAASISIAPFAGVIVDRSNRKRLIILGDTVAGLSTVAILLLHLAGNLEIWHIYLVAILNGLCSQVQTLAYSVSIPMLVPKQHYTRAISMGSVLSYGAAIIGPALAGVLYSLIGFTGILLIDLTSFIVGISTIFAVHIPQPVISEAGRQSPTGIFPELAFGFRYIFARKSLLALLLLASFFGFAHDIGDSLYSPMILARTNSNAQVLASLQAAAGVGGVTGGILLSVWGGHKRRIHSLLLGMVGAGVSKIIFGLAQIPLIWIPAQFCSSFNFPAISSSDRAIWLTKVEPDLQGKVLATHTLISGFSPAIGRLLAGPLADYIFEPAMKPDGNLAAIFGGMFGSGSGAGMALLYVICALGMLSVGLVGYAFPLLRDVEDSVPDHDAKAA
ncbi:MFS transporter [Microcoleus sp. FACHB-53]|nr:MFS transporter [Microcoleus sp. FACHB-53]